MVIYGQARADQTRPGQTLTERQTLRWWLLKFKWIFAWIFIRDRRFVSSATTRRRRERHTLSLYVTFGECKKAPPRTTTSPTKPLNCIDSCIRYVRKRIDWPFKFHYKLFAVVGPWRWMRAIEDAEDEEDEDELLFDRHLCWWSLKQCLDWSSQLSSRNIP